MFILKQQKITKNKSRLSKVFHTHTQTQECTFYHDVLILSRAQKRIFAIDKNKCFCSRASLVVVEWNYNYIVDYRFARVYRIYYTVGLFIGGRGLLGVRAGERFARAIREALKEWRRGGDGISFE